MNKTLLIIICDFLLISILALVEFKPQVEVKEPDAAALRENASEEMLELLQLSLEQENAERKAVEEALNQTQSTLSETTDALASTASALEEKSATLAETNRQLAEREQSLLAVEADKTAIASELVQTRSSLEQLVDEKGELADTLRQREAQARQLHEELARQQEETARREAALKEAEQSLQSLELTQQQLSTQLQIRETESAILQQNLVAAQAEVERARFEAERAQQRTESLAAGVSQLAASSSELREEIQRAQPVSMNALFQQFQANGIQLRFLWRERGPLGLTRREAQRQSLLIETTDGLLAIFATDDTPLTMTGARDVQLVLEIGDKAYGINDLKALASDATIAAFAVPRSLASSTGLKPFTIADDPFRFAEAILISGTRPVYGQLPVRIPPGEAGLIETENRLFNRLFGEFSPAQGDYVFSLTGELIGVMVGPDRARILHQQDFVPAQSLQPPASK